MRCLIIEENLNSIKIYIYIKIMRCKIVRTQKLMWRNIMRSTKSQKASVLHYSIDNVNESINK